MTRILVLAAVELEANGLARRLGLPRVGTTRWPHFRAGALEVACVGLRAARLAERAARCAPPTLVVSAGICGALSPDLAEGQLVIPDVVLSVSGGRFPTAHVPGVERRGALLSVDDVLEDAAAKARLWLETSALAVDMESATILRWAGAAGVPAAVVRAVSDPAGRAVPRDLASVVEADGRVKTMRAIGVALRRPGALTEAIALHRGTGAALAAVAAVLARIARTRESLTPPAI